MLGVSKRMIRYYIKEGLIPHAIKKGKYGYYDLKVLNYITIVRILNTEGNVKLSLLKPFMSNIFNKNQNYKVDKYVNSLAGNLFKTYINQRKLYRKAVERFDKHLIRR